MFRVANARRDLKSALPPNAQAQRAGPARTSLMILEAAGCHWSSTTCAPRDVNRSTGRTRPVAPGAKLCGKVTSDLVEVRSPFTDAFALFCVSAAGFEVRE